MTFVDRWDPIPTNGGRCFLLRHVVHLRPGRWTPAATFLLMTFQPEVNDWSFVFELFEATYMHPDTHTHSHTQFALEIGLTHTLRLLTLFPVAVMVKPGCRR